MANYKVNIMNRIYEVTIDDDKLIVDGQAVSYDLESFNPKGLHIIRTPNQNTEAILEPGQSGEYQIQIDGMHLNAQVVSGSGEFEEKETSGKGSIHSPMPGLIVDILVNIGDRVKKGQTILIQEAMKMQMKLKAPESGIIKSISTTAGERVEKGVLLISLAPAQ